MKAPLREKKRGPTHPEIGGPFLGGRFLAPKMGPSLAALLATPFKGQKMAPELGPEICLVLGLQTRRQALRTRTGEAHTLWGAFPSFRDP